VQASLDGATPGLSINPSVTPSLSNAVADEYTLSASDITTNLAVVNGYAGYVFVLNTSAEAVTIQVNSGGAVNLAVLPAGSFAVFVDPPNNLYAKGASSPKIKVFGFPL
jgi:archaellum component FlaG (FlaF/FlaG flagellin family)